MPPRKAIVAFSTTDPEVLAAWSEWTSAMKAQHQRLRDFHKSLDPNGIFNVYTASHKTLHHLEPKHHAEGECPPGWHLRADGTIQPDGRTKVGKAEAKRLKELNDQAPPRLKIKGMPVEIWTPNTGPGWGSQIIHSCGLFVYDGTAYAYWGAFPEGYDPDIWQEIKLSEFFAAEESYSATRPEVVLA